MTCSWQAFGKKTELENLPHLEFTKGPHLQIVGVFKFDKATSFRKRTQVYGTNHWVDNNRPFGVKTIQPKCLYNQIMVDGLVDYYKTMTISF